MKVTDVHNFEDFPFGRVLPGFVWSTNKDLVDLLSCISDFVLF